MRRLCLALLLAGCYGSVPTEPRVDPLFQAICVDSTLAHPTYRCDVVVDTVRVILPPIQNPNPQP